jgi:hypothetical protein
LGLESGTEEAVSAASMDDMVAIRVLHPGVFTFSFLFARSFFFWPLEMII